MKFVSILCATSLTLFPLLQNTPPIYSNLPLELMGIVRNVGSPARSVCLIRFALPPNNVETLRSGEKAFELAEVQNIDTDGVVIRNLVSEGLEYLTFSKNRPSPIQPSPIPAVPQVTAISPDRIDINISTDVFEHYAKNLPEILDSAFAAPHFRKDKDGKQSIEGFEISRIKEAGIADRMKLQNGDIILAVNGEPLDSLATVMRLLGKIQNMAEGKMSVLRGGRKLDFVFKRK